MPTRPEASGKKVAEVPSYGEASLCYSVPEAGRLLGLTKSAAYAAGRPIRVPKVAFHRMLDIEAETLPDHRRR
jgi:hypothetical protein